jgi:hypothetical protein
LHNDEEVMSIKNNSNNNAIIYETIFFIIVKCDQLCFMNSEFTNAYLFFLRERERVRAGIYNPEFIRSAQSFFITYKERVAKNSSVKE